MSTPAKHRRRRRHRRRSSFSRMPDHEINPDPPVHSPLPSPFSPFSSRFFQRLSRFSPVPRIAKVNWRIPSSVRFRSSEKFLRTMKKRHDPGPRFSASPRDAHERVAAPPELRSRTGSRSRDPRVPRCRVLVSHLYILYPRAS